MRPRLALCALAAAASAYRAANFDISTDLALAYACGRQCQEAVAAGSKIDRLMFGDDFDFDFYASADNLTNSRPGNILKLEAMDATQRTFKKGTKAWRFQYTTVDLDGSLVPATAFIAFPSAVTGQSGHDNSSTTMGQKRFRLVAWAHGTSGLFRGCAPSNGPGLFDYGTWQPLVSRGYAVVATDYAGLGNDHTLHKYGSFRTHAADVYYSAVAARNVFGHALTREWMSAGHSQGGGAVWKLAESGLVRHDAGYLGTVALAPATSVVDMLVRTGARNPTLLPAVVVGAERANVSFSPRLLSATLRRRMQLAGRARLCHGGAKGTTADLRRDAAAMVRTEPFGRGLEGLRAWQMAPDNVEAR